MKPVKRPFDKEKFKRSYANSPVQVKGIVDHVLEKKGLTDIQNKLNHLWEHWDITLGSYLSSVALPIGHRKKILLIAGEDNVVLNELTYAKEEILERVHAFLGEEYFEKIELHLLFGQRPLNQPIFLSQAPLTKLIRPDNLGSLNLPEGKVKQAYLHYLSLFAKEK